MNIPEKNLRFVPFVIISLLVIGCSRAQMEQPRPGSRASDASQSAGNQRMALDEYVAAPDTNYSFRLVNRVAGAGQTTYILEMTSQAWLTTNEVDRPLWKHWVNIVKPEAVSSSKSLLTISGGKNGGSPPKGADGNSVQIALATKSVVTELKMIPNQPLVFAGETEGRVEDSLIAYTWDKFLRTGDSKWPARLPMTKAAVRAMDTVVSFCGTSDAGGLQLS